jgi:hypothetical protein
VRRWFVPALALVAIAPVSGTSSPQRQVRRGGVRTRARAGLATLAATTGDDDQRHRYAGDDRAALLFRCVRRAPRKDYWRPPMRVSVLFLRGVALTGSRPAR